MIKFLDVLSRYESSEFGQLKAAELLGVGERTFRRWCHRHKEDGEAGLMDRRLGRKSNKRVPKAREVEVEALYRSRYSGFTARQTFTSRPTLELRSSIDFAAKNPNQSWLSPRKAA